MRHYSGVAFCRLIQCGITRTLSPLFGKQGIGGAMENRRQYLALAALALFMRTGEARTSSATLMGNLPLSFEPNRGQAGPDVKFLSHDRGYTLYLTPSEAVLSTSVGNKPLCVRMRFVDANSNLRFEGLDELPGKANYFIGSDLGKWRANIPTYQKVRAEDIYPGIDLVYYGMRGQLEYDLILKPGADPSRIRIGFQGIS